MGVYCKFMFLFVFLVTSFSVGDEILSCPHGDQLPLRVCGTVQKNRGGTYVVECVREPGSREYARGQDFGPAYLADSWRRCGEVVADALNVSQPPADGSLWTYSFFVKDPESTYFDPETQDLFISNIEGGGTDKDGKGRIMRWVLDPKPLRFEANWVEGLNAPKGMRAHDGILWVSDIDEVVGIEIATAKVVKRFSIAQAKFLNDIVVDADGRVYVSDTIGNAIYVIENDQVSVFVAGEEWEGPNGLLLNGNELIVASWGKDIQPDFSASAAGHLYGVHLQTKEKRLITSTRLGNLDGLEMLSDGDYLVSDWVAGKVYQVTESKAGNAPSVKLLVEGLKGPADIGLSADKKTLVVPAMGSSLIKAWDLSSI